MESTPPEQYQVSHRSEKSLVKQVTAWDTSPDNLRQYRITISEN